MSSPYVYTPHPSYATSGYVNTSYQTPQNSPFIPNATLYPTSPYSNPIPLGGGSPSIPALSLPANINNVPFPPYETPYDSGPWSAPFRQRRPSWHGNVSPASPFSPGFLQPDPGTYFRDRRRSFGAGDPYQQPVAWGPSLYGAQIAPPSSPSGFHLHPWLNAEVWRGDFVFDLTAHDFNPLQVVNSIGQFRPLSAEALAEPATHPPINRLRIICDLIPEWPIDIQYNPYYNGTMGPAPSSPGFSVDPTGTQPPITFGDVLIAIHRHLHTRISHVDWARLTVSQETAVARAYARRCKAMGSLENVERAQGVKRVDYLLDRKWFRGCVLDWKAGVFRLVVG